MAVLATAMATRFRDSVRALSKSDARVERALTWIRTIALEDDVVCVDTSGDRVYLSFPFPSSPSRRASRVDEPTDRSRVRFVVRTGDRARGAAASEEAESAAGLHAIMRMQGLELLERDWLRERDRPLRFGLRAEEARAALAHVRRSAESWLAEKRELPVSRDVAAFPRLAQWTSVGVALWTRGQLRGSIVMPPGVVLRTLGQATRWACEDARFEPLSATDLDETLFQVTLVHAPSLPLSREAVAGEDAYPDKAVFLSEGNRSGIYLPEIFNIAPRRKMSALTESLARDKAGLPGVGPSTSIEIAEVTEFVESANRQDAVRLDGPVARSDGAAGGFVARARASGVSVCDWLARIARDDGALPLRVRPSSGHAEGLDPVRMAATAESLVAFGKAAGLDSAVLTARRVLTWLEQARPQWTADPAQALLTSCYRGRAGLLLGDDSAVDVAATDALLALQRVERGPLPLAQALSLLTQVSPRRADARACIEPLTAELHDLFTRAMASKASMSLAEWAEIVAAGPEASTLAHDVRSWLCSLQLASGAFPDTTTSDFAYSRGTGKIFEVLALRRDPASHVAPRAAAWLLSMQYRADSLFFVPTAHRARVLGGLRHDYANADAWIDSAAHLLLGLARLERP